MRPAVARAVVVATLAILVACGLLASRVTHDDDVLAFLPEGNADIATFHRLNERFGSTDVALVGIPTDDPFDPRFLDRLRSLTRKLRDTEGLDSVLSLTNVADFRDDPETGGIITDELVSDLPVSEQDRLDLRDKVMSRDHIVGTLISRQADAVVVYAFGLPGSQPRDLAHKVRHAVEQHLPDAQVWYGGAPFISTYIYETTQADMARLTPWAVMVIILIMLAAFRDLLGSALGLLATTVGIVVSHAAMVATGHAVNIVLSSMPIILFAIGSAYAIHILSHVDRHAREVGAGPEAVIRTLTGTGPTVVAAGLTTAAGLGSFVVMDIAPMQSFGWFTALGILVALVTSLTFVPAVLALWPRPVKAPLDGPLKPAMHALVEGIRRHRASVAVVVGLVTLMGIGLAGQVETRMDLRAFFHEGSPPDRAQSFLDDKFGGSTYIQLAVQADLEDPALLREVERIADRIATLPKVTEVQSVGAVIGLVGESMTGVRRIPDTRGQLGLLYRFASSDPSFGRLITPQHDEALLQIKVGTSDADEVDATLAAIRALLDREAAPTLRVVPRTDADRSVRHEGITTHLRSLLRAYQVPEPRDLTPKALALLSDPPPAAKTGRVVSHLSDFLSSQESFVVLQDATARQVATAVAQAGPANEDDEALTAAIDAALRDAGSDADPMDVAIAIAQPVEDAWRAARAHARAEQLISELDLAMPLGGPGARLRSRLADKLQDLEAPTLAVAAPSPDAEDSSPVQWTVSGMPVLYQGLSRSVRDNQFRSLALALSLIFVIMSGMYRSISSGLLATAPTAFTLVAVYGGMGWLGVRLDIGTSMLASIILGAGVDYAVHMLAAWQGDDPREAAHRAVAETSHPIWTNALMVSAGFFVLTLGDARPLENVGGLTAAALLLAAFSTFLIVPLLAGRTRYDRVTSPTTQETS